MLIEGIGIFLRAADERLEAEMLAPLYNMLDDVKAPQWAEVFIGEACRASARSDENRNWHATTHKG